MPIIKGYTIYLYSQNRSCLYYFPVDGTNKKAALNLGKGIAKLFSDYYKSIPIQHGISRITVEVEEYKPNH